MRKVDVDIIDPGGPDRPARVQLRVMDAALAGKRATLSIEETVLVKDDRPVNESHSHFQRDLVLPSAGASQEIEIPPGRLQTFAYRGDKIDIVLRTRVVVDDSLLFDTKIDETHDLGIIDKPKVKNDAAAIIEPADVFRFFANLKAIPFHNQIITLLLVAVGGIVMLINALVGVHDQFVPEMQTWLYSHYDSDGEGSSPLAAALTGSGVLGVMVWFLMKGQLRKYMKFHWQTLPGKLRPGIDYPVGKFFAGKARVPLQDVTLRIVASNMECGQYKRQSGSKTRTVSFREPVRGVVLFEKTVAHIPANMPVNQWFDGDRFRFDGMFEVLYPPNMLSKTHGLDVHWEMQLIHPEFVDHELEGPKGCFAYQDFLQQELTFEL